LQGHGEGAGAAGQGGVGGQHGVGVARGDVDGASVAGGDVLIGRSGRDSGGGGGDGGGRGRGAGGGEGGDGGGGEGDVVGGGVEGGHAELGRDGRAVVLDARLGPGDRGVVGVGGGDRPGSRRLQGGVEVAGAVGEGGVAGQDGLAVTRGEMDGARVADGDVV